MKKLICLILGHTYEDVEKKDPTRHYLTWNFIICSRCGKELDL